MCETCKNKHNLYKHTLYKQAEHVSWDAHVHVLNEW